MSDHPSCPLCGAAIVDDGRVLLDIDTRHVLVGHLRARLTRLEMSIFARLWQRRPRVLSREVLLEASAKPGRDDDRNLETVQVVMVNLRRKIDPLGLRIITEPGGGYRIERLSEGAAP